MAERRRVLVVDDDPDVRELLAAFLGRRGHDVTCADSFEGALDLWKRHRFDVALVDIGLPDGSGVDLARELGELRRCTRIAFISGCTETVLEHDESIPFFHKPLALADVAAFLELSARDVEVLFGDVDEPERVQPRLHGRFAKTG